MKHLLSLNTYIPAALLLVLMAVVPDSAWPADSVDHTLFDGLLKKHVQSGMVDYQGFKQDENRLDDYLNLLEKVNPDILNRNEKFAFYINAYNAWTIKLILTGYPGVKSIKDLGGWFSSPWKKKFVRINGKVITLDDIEHGILRPEFRDPRVHFAVNCASKSCPPLRPEAYTGSRLDNQLNDAAKSFINDSKSNYLRGDDLYISRIFKWFGEDFGNDLISFFIQYAQGDLRSGLMQRKENIDIHYLDYDWSLNGQ